MSAPLSSLLCKKNPDEKITVKKKSSLSLVDNETSVGVEIEMENLQTNYMNRSVLQGWERKSDGSLRGTSREFVTSSPIKGDSVIVALENLQEAFEDKRFDKHKTLRTSMHVHVNMLSLNKEQLIAVLIAAMLADKALFSMTGENREFLGFSKLSTEALAEVIAQLIPQKDQEGFNLPSINSRYFSMNTGALGKYGTLEFRHFSTPDTVEEAVDYINACLKVKDCGIKAWESAGNDDIRYNMEVMYHLTRAQVEAAFGTAHEMMDVQQFTDLLEELSAIMTNNPDTMSVPEDLNDWQDVTITEEPVRQTVRSLQDYIDEWELMLESDRRSAINHREQWLHMLSDSDSVGILSVDLWQFLKSAMGHQNGMMANHIVKAKRPPVRLGESAVYDYFRITETYVDTSQNEFNMVYETCVSARIAARNAATPTPRAETLPYLNSTGYATTSSQSRVNLFNAAEAYALRHATRPVDPETF